MENVINFNMLHHYTSIETLALILRSRKMRFNRLDRVDDVAEGHTFGEHSLVPFIFVSCWTDSSEENIPLWQMYTGNMRGVRLSFPENPFHYRDIPAGITNGIEVAPGIKSPIELDEMIGPNYIILPTFFRPEKFGKKVQYVDDIRGIYKDAVKFNVGVAGGFQGSIQGIGDMAMHKSRSWQFQEEYRFTLCILPTPGRMTEFPSDYYASFMSDHLRRGVGSQLAYFDVGIDPAKLSNMEITLGPLASFAEQTIVESLLLEYCGHKKIKKSVLSGTIRARS